MCFALPASNGKNRRESRLPETFRIMAGGLVLLLVLFVSLLAERLVNNR